MKIYLTFILLFVFLLGCTSNSQVIKCTTGLKQKEQKAFFDKKIISLSKTEKGISIIQLQLDDEKKEKEETTEFCVNGIINFIEDHTYSIFLIKSISEEGIEIEYFWKFDHNSFGKGLIEEDTGKFKFKWKSKIVSTP